MPHHGRGISHEQQIPDWTRAIELEEQVHSGELSLAEYMDRMNDSLLLFDEEVER